MRCIHTHDSRVISIHKGKAKVSFFADGQRPSPSLKLIIQGLTIFSKMADVTSCHRYYKRQSVFIFSPVVGARTANVICRQRFCPTCEKKGVGNPFSAWFTTSQLPARGLISSLARIAETEAQSLYSLLLRVSEFVWWRRTRTLEVPYQVADQQRKEKGPGELPTSWHSLVLGLHLRAGQEAAARWRMHHAWGQGVSMPDETTSG